MQSINPFNNNDLVEEDNKKEYREEDSKASEKNVNFCKRKRFIMKLKFKKNNNPFSKKNFEIDRQKAFIDKEIYSETSELFDIKSEEEYKSLTQLQLERSNNKKNIIIKNIKTNKKISFEKINKFFDDNDIENLKKYKFPFMPQSNFNYEIKKIDLRKLRMLYFACPICDKPYRHFSMNYHIFQNHFKDIEKYLSKKNIAQSCGKLMEKEFKKIDNSLKTFSELAVIFNNCDFIGSSEWSRNANNCIKYIKNLNIKKTFFNITKEEAFQSLSKKLPLNKNRKYKK